MQGKIDAKKRILELRDKNVSDRIRQEREAKAKEMEAKRKAAEERLANAQAASRRQEEENRLEVQGYQIVIMD